MRTRKVRRKVRKKGRRGGRRETIWREMEKKREINRGKGEFKER